MAIERVKPIELTDNDTGKVYTLEFNRDTVRRAEKNGFSIDDCSKFPTMCYDLWYYAFLMHHDKDIRRKKTSRDVHIRLKRDLLVTICLEHFLGSSDHFVYPMLYWSKDANAQYMCDGPKDANSVPCFWI